MLEPDGTAARVARVDGHMLLVHAFFAVRYSDPWVQKEWASSLLRQGRMQEAVKHFGVGSYLLGLCCLSQHTALLDVAVLRCY